MSTRSDVTFQPFAGAAPQASVGRPTNDEPFRLLVLGDFSGRASRGISEPLVGRRARRVDRDDLDTVLSSLNAEINVPTHVKGQPVQLPIRALDDLHPDALWERLEVFGRLRALRGRLSNPETFASAARELRPDLVDTAGPAADRTDVAASTAIDADAEPTPELGLLEATLAETDAAPDRTASTLVDAIVRDLVIPRIPATPGQSELIDSVDQAAAEEMRSVLASPALRKLESTWRSIEMLVRRVETDTQLQIWIFDVTPEEIVHDLVTHDDPKSGETWRALFELDDADTSPRWSAWISLELTFGATTAQAALLRRIGRLAATAQTPFLAAAHEKVAGCPSIHTHPDPDDWASDAPEESSAWASLRDHAEMNWVLLSLPRVILRPPYGRRTNPTERFRFEELHSPPEHEDFLWGTGALVPILALTKEFSRTGWELTTEGQWEIDRLDTPVYEDGGEVMVKPCAEAVLSERAGTTLRSSGITPLATVRDTDRVRVGPLRSVAGTPLSGRWMT